MAVTYEWAVETLDEHGNVVDVDHARTYAQAMRGYLDGRHVALVRDDEWSGQDYYYVPFTDEAMRLVPKRYREQVERAGVLPSDRPALDCAW